MCIAARGAGGRVPYRLNMELHPMVKSPQFIWAPCALCAAVHIEGNPQPPPPALGLIYKGDISQPRKTTSLCDPFLGYGLLHW